MECCKNGECCQRPEVLLDTYTKGFNVNEEEGLFSFSEENRVALKSLIPLSEVRFIQRALEREDNGHLEFPSVLYMYDADFADFVYVSEPYDKLVEKFTAYKMGCCKQ